MYFWQPLGGTVWTVENHFLQGILYTSFALGWVMVAGAEQVQALIVVKLDAR